MISYQDTEETIDYSESAMDYSNKTMILLSKSDYDNWGDAGMKIEIYCNGSVTGC